MYRNDKCCVTRPIQIGPRRRAGRLRQICILPGLLVISLALSACGDVFTRTQLLEESCVRVRLSAAAISYQDAKALFVEHFKVRSDRSLRFAYMASLDSSRLAVSIKGCFDFDRSFVNEAKSILRSNRVLRKLVKNTMRDSDAQLAIGIFGDEYREIFKNDIN